MQCGTREAVVAAEKAVTELLAVGTPLQEGLSQKVEATGSRRAELLALRGCDRTVTQKYV